MPRWELVHVGPENDDFEIGGLKAWRYQWFPSSRGSVVIELPKPNDPARHKTFNIYEIGAKPVMFAAAEVSYETFAFCRETD